MDPASRLLASRRPCSRSDAKSPRHCPCFLLPRGGSPEQPPPTRAGPCSRPAQALRQRPILKSPRQPVRGARDRARVPQPRSRSPARGRAPARRSGRARPAPATAACGGARGGTAPRTTRTGARRATPVHWPTARAAPPLRLLLLLAGGHLLLQHADPDEPAWVHGLAGRARRGPSPDGEQALRAREGCGCLGGPRSRGGGPGSGIVGDNDDGHGVEVEDEDLLYRVPVFDPMLAELYNPMPVDDFQEPLEQKPAVCCFVACLSAVFGLRIRRGGAADGFTGFDVVPDMELASFAADMESLLMGGVEEGYDDLRFLDEEKPQLNLDFDMADFDDQSQSAAPAPEQELEDWKRKRSDSGMILKLDYERVIDSWAHDGGSPWFYGERPHIDPTDDSWLDMPAGSRGFGLAQR
ncbi:hypothetical protein ZWY2020_053726 [Hordeum vulgare]|nr:hypothetical protein ZWY2020_053726 [Hordeum vulgare]